MGLTIHDFEPNHPTRHLENGTYRARITGNRRGTTGKPAHEIDLLITDGPACGHRFTHKLWLTDRAMPHTLAWLGPFGIDSPDQLHLNQLSGYELRIEIGSQYSDWRRRSFRTVQVLEVLDGNRKRPRPVQGTAWNPPAGEYLMHLFDVKPAKALTPRGRPCVRGAWLYFEVINGPHTGYGIRPQIHVPKEQRKQPLPEHLQLLGVKKCGELHLKAPVGSVFVVQVVYRQIDGQQVPVIRILKRVASGRAA